MITNPIIDMRVKFVADNLDAHPSDWENELGVIIGWQYRDHNLIAVEFDNEIQGKRQWNCACEDLVSVILTPEEEAEWKEKCRQNKERQLDQQRRLAHAMKYL